MPAPLDRPVPYDLGAEDSLLSALLQADADTLARATADLRPADFYRDANGWIYGAIRDLDQRHVPIDMQTLGSELTRQDRLAAIGGYARLAELLGRQVSPWHAEHYARPIRATAALRRLITAGGLIAGLGYEEGADLEDVFTRAERALLDVTQANRRAVGTTDIQALYAYATGLQERIAAGGAMPGRSTGIGRLDVLTGGCCPRKLWILTGESGGGKSTVALALALNLKRTGAAVGLFSLEMDETELAERELASRAGVNTALLKSGQLSAAQQDAVWAAYDALIEETPIRLLTGGGFGLRDIAAQARRWQADGGLDALIVDYAQLVRLPGRDKVSELDDLANGLKSLAMEMGITLIAATQLSKAAVGRDAREWDDYMRGSQAFKQAADVVIAVAPQGERPEDGTQPWPVTLAVTKHRGGPTGDVDTLWWLAYSRIGEVSNRYLEVVR